MKTFLLLLVLSGVAMAQSPPYPSPPALTVDTTYILPVGGTTYNVLCSGGGSDHGLQTAINAAVPGDVIVVQNGCTYSGNMTVPMLTNGSHKWIYIQSSAYSSLPSPGTRVGPGDAANMPAITTPNTTAPITFAPGANYWRLVGLEVRSDSTAGGDPTADPPASPFSYYALQTHTVLTNGCTTPTNTTPVDHIIFDRLYVHGSNSQDIVHGVDLTGSYMALIDSYESDIHGHGSDTQGILTTSWGAGPGKIDNNFIEASTENIFFTADDCQGNTFNPYNEANYYITNNWVYKPLAWQKCGMKGTVSPSEYLADGSLCASNVASITSSSWSSGTETLGLSSSDLFSASETVDVFNSSNSLVVTVALASATGSPTTSVTYSGSNPGSLNGGHVSASVTSPSWAAGTVTFGMGNASTNWQLTNPSDVFVSGCSQSGYNGTFTLTGLTSSTIQYHVASNPGSSPTGCKAIGANNEWAQKDSMELKTGQLMSITGNLFENSWPGAQTGFCFGINEASQNATNLFVADILFQNNICKNVDRATYSRYQDPTSGYTWRGYSKRVEFYNNLFQLSTDVGFAHYGWNLDGGFNDGTGNPTIGPTDWIFQHNTMVRIDGQPLDLPAYFDYFYGSPQSPSYYPTHNVWVLDNVMNTQPNGGNSFITTYGGVTGLMYYTGDPAGNFAARYLGNVMYVPSGTLQTWPAQNLATATAPTFDGNNVMLTPNYSANTSDGKQSGWLGLGASTPSSYPTTVARSPAL